MLTNDLLLQVLLGQLPHREKFIHEIWIILNHGFRMAQLVGGKVR